MVKFLKYGRVCVLLNGRQAGKKAVIVKSVEEGTKERKYPHALVAGLERGARKVTKKMSKKKVQKRTNLKPFVKYVNLNHVMPTRYSVTGEVDFKAIVSDDKMAQADKRAEMKKALKLALQEKYRNMPVPKSAHDKTSHLKFFYKKLRF